MSFLDKLKQQAGTVADAAGIVAKSAVKQTKTLASAGRIKLAIATEEDKLKKAYTELGRLFYRDYEAQAEAGMEDYQPWCDKVSDAKAQIARLNEELERVKAAEEEPEEAAPAEPEKVIEVDYTAGAAETEPPEEPLAEDAPVEEGPVVDTLYVDVTNTEEE